MNFVEAQPKKKLLPEILKISGIFLVLTMLIIMSIASYFYNRTSTYAQVFTSTNSVGSSSFSRVVNTVKLFEKKEVKGQQEDRINILFLGMRGEDDPQGGLLADSIQIVSIEPSTNKIAMIGIPRDLYASIPGETRIRKINSIHSIGEKKGKYMGMEYMKDTIEETFDLPIHYVFRIDMITFKNLVDYFGGIDLYLEKSFTEDKQYEEVFYLPKGENHLDGDDTYKYCRSRYTSNDFDRQRRQQDVMFAIKDEVVESDIISKPTQWGEIANLLQDDVRVDSESISELKQLVEMFVNADSSNMKRIVFSTAEGGRLYSTRINRSYALRPIGDDFSLMKGDIENIFN